MLNKLSREQLYQRHHLSHQQIDDFLGEKESGNYPELKGQILGKVHDFRVVSNILFDQNIEFIPLKGPMLSYRLYGDMSYRNFGDLDFLMDRSSIEPAIKKLKENGYECPLYDWHIEVGTESQIFDHYHHIVLINPHSNIHLELHWRLFNYKFAGKGITDEMIANSKTSLKYEERGFQVFNPEFELLYLIIHGGLHAWQWLKWLVDIHDFINNIPFSREKFNQLAKSLDAQRMIQVCNTLLQDYFPDSPLLPQSSRTPPFLYKYATDQLQGIEEGDFSLMGRIKHHWYRMQCFPGLKYKWSVLSHIFLYPEQLENDQLSRNRLLYYLGGMSKKLKRRI